MTTRFIHAADVHLGYHQYHNSERYNDFARAFDALVQDALDRRVDFVLLAGDLFHKRSIEPRTLFQAVHYLERLAKASIPVLAVEGNHERTYHGETFSWLEFLAHRDLIVLLTPVYRDGEIDISPWDATTKRGAYYDMGSDLRVYGCKYFGSSTPRVVEDMAAALAKLPSPRPAYTIMMLHAGLRGILDHYAATLSRGQLNDLAPHVDYIALGHIHKPFVQDDWIYNPGSLENTSATEAAWDERGYYHVEVAPGHNPAHRVTPVQGKRRPFHVLRCDIDEWKTPQALYEGLGAYLEVAAHGAAQGDKPVVQLHLEGVLAFDQADLDMARIEALVVRAYDPLLARVRNDTQPSDFEIRVTRSLSRAELERQVLRGLVERDERRRADSDRWASLAIRCKDLALSKAPPGEIIADLRAFLDEVEV